MFDFQFFSTSRRRRPLTICSAIPMGLMWFFAACLASADDTEISFSRDIQPILARKCFACHGPDETHREADLRLDSREVAIDLGAIVPGKPTESELVRRILSNDPDERMPPADANETLTDEEKQQIRAWIRDGAKYEQHWAFRFPQRPAVPKPPADAATVASWPRNPIDHFILARLLGEGLRPSPEADRHALVRRVYLDLIGLPPTPTEAEQFVDDKDPRAYEKLVDRLLESKHYGERWARQWLDLARYSDTNGYEKDRPRSIWPYRDWVIKALNDDMPFDQFTIHQLAGDMLPDATMEQKVATGFHRNTMLNEEGGIDPLEYRFYAMVDRVATTGTVWLGLTTGCAQCHSHKYDPISHTDYYRLMALLNNADEPDQIVADAAVETRRQQIEKQIEQLESKLADQFPPSDGAEPVDDRRRKNLEQKFNAWIKTQRGHAVRWKTLRPSRMKSNLPRLEQMADGSIFSSGDITKRDVFTLTFQLDQSQTPLTALRLEVLPDDRLPARGPGRAYYEGRKGDFFLSEVSATHEGTTAPFGSASHSYGKISIGSGGADAMNVTDGDGSTGWATAQREGKASQLVLVFKNPLTNPRVLEIELLFERHFAASLGRFRLSATSGKDHLVAKVLPVDLEALLTTESDSWTRAKAARLKRYFLRIAPELAEANKKIDQLRKQLPALATTMIMEERPADHPRQSFRHHRGEYLSPREQVSAGVPAVFPPLPDNGPADRMALARWLVSDRNPLVGRVTVNRAWRAFFGTGIVETSGDFGTQSNPPSHPELLDWLAREFVEPTGSGLGDRSSPAKAWSLKQLHRLIVTSATYRQRSRITPELLRRDPSNRWLARGPLYRVEAETVRDIMLKASGLLSSKMYGPSVFPPQPASVTGLAYGATRWNVSKGEDRYRRSLYTFSKRTAPFAAYSVFDGPTGENCLARRDRSNTPLQALTLLNDEMFLEMSRALAKEAVGRHSANREATATFIFQRFLTRPPTADELKSLLDYQQRQQQRLAVGELNAKVLSGNEEATAELAAWSMVARVVMNLDEAITKP